MRLILSRKGFDSSAGGHPTPILPDGTLLSLPIADIVPRRGIPYAEMHAPRADVLRRDERARDVLAWAAELIGAVVR